MWLMPGGGEKWFRLGFLGFTEFNPENIYRMGWEGRFEGSGSILAGFVDGMAVVASSPGGTQQLFSGDAFTGDADGGELDFFQIHNDGVEAYFNPVSGDGLQMVFKATNTFMGEETQGNTHVFSIYEIDGVRRVFHSLEGLDS
jgi:hypothetical protein